jgi:AcrR family transcriptional regulator
MQVRAIARKLAVSHGAPAKHFADKEQLFAALAEEGFDLIDKRFSEIWDPRTVGRPRRPDRTAAAVRVQQVDYSVTTARSSRTPG